MSKDIYIKNAHVEFGSLVDTISYDTPFGHRVRYETTQKGKREIRKLVMRLLKERQNGK
nr:hypothetical protein [Candidatus Enterousia merdequi]